MSPVSSNRTFIQTFHFRPKGSPKTVHITGNFDSWGRTVVMKPTTADPSLWEAIVQLPLLDSGLIQYKYVLDGQEWVIDDKAEKTTLPSGITNNSLPVPEDSVNYSWSQASLATFQGEIQSPGLGTSKNKRKKRNKSKKTLTAAGTKDSDLNTLTPTIQSPTPPRSTANLNGHGTTTNLPSQQLNEDGGDHDVVPVTTTPPPHDASTEPPIDTALPPLTPAKEKPEILPEFAGTTAVTGTTAAAGGILATPSKADEIPVPTRVEATNAPLASSEEEIPADSSHHTTAEGFLPKATDASDEPSHHTTTEVFPPKAIDASAEPSHHTLAEDFLPKATDSPVPSDAKSDLPAPPPTEKAQADTSNVVAQYRSELPSGIVEPTSTPKDNQSPKAETTSDVVDSSVDVPELVKATEQKSIVNTPEPIKLEQQPIDVPEPVRVEQQPTKLPEPVKAEQEPTKAPEPIKAEQQPVKASEPVKASKPVKVEQPSPAPATSPAKSPETSSGKKSSKKSKVSSPSASGDSVDAEGKKKKKKGIFGKLKKIFN
ncbi:MAG: hypothetical protein DHS80DRAFT_25003 [Piptocephalis tieghemiana]|nr:MAG: hypothetical protein DHS80DRAFT_25003 [Piptocephalis tieghemiana]